MNELKCSALTPSEAMSASTSSGTTLIEVPIHNIEEMKQTVVQYGQINDELKRLQERAKKLRNERETLSSNIQTFMHFNQLSTCHISKNLNTNIRKIRLFEKETKQRVTVKMIEELFGEFFGSIDQVRFLNLSNEEKSQSFFEFLETKRERKVLRSIIIK